MIKTNENNLDAYSPAQVAHLVEAVGIRKATRPLLQTLVLAVLAGAFIAFGAMLYTLVISVEGGVGSGLHRWIGGVAFSLGLILVLIAGAELFTGNNLIVMAWADKKISTLALLKNWILVYIGNFIGAIACALLYYWSGAGDTAELSQQAIDIASAKSNIDFSQALVRGVLCNVLVCLAVWMCMASHRVSGKILCIIFPVSAFVALGFEHSIANMYLIPVGMLFESGVIEWGALWNNLLPVTIGNILGGGVMVALVYWLIYLYGET